MKRIIAVLLCLIFTVSAFAGCGSAKRENYQSGTKKLVKLPDLSSIPLDTESEDFKTTLSSQIDSDLSAYPEERKQGTVQDGDVVNLDYLGKADGVAFSGGTAKGYDLTIGSGSFIDGFESSLIGHDLGTTFDIQVTFPEGYKDSTDAETGKNTIVLSGKPVVFTVTLNSLKRPGTQVDDAFAKRAGYDSSDAYMEHATLEAKKNYLYDYLIQNSEILGTPADNEKTGYEFYKNYYTSMASQYGMTFESFLTSNSLDEAGFKKEVLKPELIMYAVFDHYKLKVTKKEVDDKIAEMAEELSSDAATIEEQYTRNYVEYLVVCEKALDRLCEKLG